MTRLKHILTLTIMLLAGLASFGQSGYVIDEVCIGAERYYRVDGEPGSTFTWTLTEPDGVTTHTLPETNDSVFIIWNYIAGAGTYNLSTEQENPVTGCTNIELGQIIVHELPVAYAGVDVALCAPLPYTLAFADTSYASTLLWTTSGDGTFNDATILQPEYTFGANDILNGTVTLTLTAEGLGESGSCPPAESSVIITLDNLLVIAEYTPVSCSGLIDGTVQLTATGGTEPYTYTLNTSPPETNSTGLFTGLAAGTYTYLVTDAQLCEVTGEVTVTEPEPLVVTTTFTDPTTFGGADGTATATVTGGTPPYSYLWDDPAAQTTATAINLTAGTYTVTVTDANGCITTGTVTLTDPGAPLAVIITNVVNVSCFGFSDGEATAVASGGTEPYTYLWNDPAAQTTATATGLAAGTYTVTVTDADGATVTETVTITEPTELIVTTTFTNPTTPGGNDGTATATVTGGTPPFSYLWDDPAAQTTATAINLTAGTYTVTVTDANGCITTGTVTLTDPGAPLAVIITNVVNVSCFGFSDGEATAVASGGTEPYTYLWNDPAAQTTATATGLAAGTYTVTVTDADGATVTETVTITEPTELIVATTFTNPTTPGGNDGTATATVTGGTPPYSYLWDDPAAQTTATAFNLTAGTYTVTVTDANGCITTGTVTLTDPGAPLAVIITNVVNVSCFGFSDGEATAVASGGTEPYTYLWNDPAAQTTATATNLAAGTYTVTVTDADGATVTETVTITEPEELIVATTFTNPTTVGGNDGTATATVTGGTPPYSYLWDDPGAQTTATAINLTAGTYTVTVTVANGCITTGTVTLTDPGAPLAIIITNVVNVSCFGFSDGEATAVASGGTEPYTYLWDDPATQTTATATGLAAGTYTVTVTDADGAIVTETVTITEPTELIVTTTFTNPTTAGGNDGTATATVTGGTPPYSYLWDDPTAQTTATAINLTAGTYTVTVTDANGCIATGTVTLNDPGAPLAVIITNVVNVSCFSYSDGEATAVASGGTEPYTYLWNDPAAQTTATATNLAAGTYTVTVTDAGGTIVTETVTITEPTELIVTTTFTNPTTIGGNDGTATATVTGGTPPYSYLWDDPAAQTTATAINLTAGTYTVTVTDANGCITTGTVILTDPGAPLAVVIINVVNVSCFGFSDGEATAVASGGTEPYTYLWNDPAAQTTATATGLAAGTYTVTVTDADGATVTETVTITEPTELIVSTTFTNPTTPGGNDGTATATVTGGTPPYAYLWDDPAAQTTATAINLTAETYTVTVTDANGCTTTAIIILTDPGAPLAVIITNVVNVSCFGFSDGEATAVASGGTEPYTYLWNDPAAQTTATATNLAAGTYTVTVTDADGAIVTETVTITEPTELIVATSFTNPTTIGGNDGTATATVTGGTPPYSYLWDDPAAQTTATAINLTAGTYTVTVTDANGCITTGTVTLTEPGAPLAVIITNVVNVTCFGFSDGEATAVASGGIEPYTYLWDDIASQATATATGLAAGTYTVTVTDAVGATVTETVTITEPTELIVITTFTNPTTIGGNDGTATATVTGGTPPYSYLWDDPAAQTTATAINLTAGTYTVTVTDANGCITTGTVTLTDPGAPLAVIITNVVNVSCFGFSDGEATAVASGGTEPYTYLWDDIASQATATATGLAAGTYTVTVTDAVGATVTETVTITEPTELIVITTFTNPTTIGGNDGTATAAVTGGTPPYSYLWDDPAAQTTATAINLTAGTYTVTVTDANGCITTGTVILTDPGAPLAVIITNVVNVSCFGFSDGEATAVASGGTEPYTYLWNDLAAQTTATATNLAAGTYTVTVTDADGTIVTETVTITEPTQLVVTTTFTNPTTVGGSDGTATATVTGGTPPYSYLWDDPAAQTTATAINLTAGIYTVTVTDANGCITTGTVILTDPGAPLAVIITNVVNVSCFGFNDGEATAAASGGTEPYTYLWNDPAAQTTATATGLAAGTYTVTVTDADGVTITETVTITEPDVLFAVTEAEMIGCTIPTGSITFTGSTGGSGNFGYSIDGGITWQTSPYFGDLVAGNYNPVIRDAEETDCFIALPPVTINESPPINITISNTDSTTCDEANGMIDATADGGSGTFEYSLEDGSGNATPWQPTGLFTDLSTGSYRLTVHDDTGCEITYNQLIRIEAITPVEIITVEVTHSINGETSGTLTVEATSPALPLQYSLDSITWQSSNVFTDLPAGFYTVYAMDANGCVDIWQTQIGNVILGEIELISGRVTECVGDIKALEISVYEFDSISSFRIQLTYNPMILRFVGFGTIHYNLVPNLMVATEISPGVLEISYEHPGVVSVPDGELLAELMVQGIAAGMSMLDWQWLECVVMSPVGLLPGVTAVVNEIAEVFANPTLIGYTSGEYCPGDSTIIYAEANMDNLVYTWTHPRGITHDGPVWDLGVLSEMDGGNYIIEAKQDQCYSLDTVSITVFPQPLMYISYEDTLCFGNPVVLDPKDTFAEYEWSTGSNMPTIIAYEAGVYWLKIVDINGCRAIDTVTLEPCLIEVLVPNAFTPNGDGLNDDFKPIFTGFEPGDYRMDIYSKWGQLLFTTSTLSEGWDGRVNGELVPPDTFVYVISYEVPSYVMRVGLTSPITGRVSVIR